MFTMEYVCTCLSAFCPWRMISGNRVLPTDGCFDLVTDFAGTDSMMFSGQSGFVE